MESRSPAEKDPRLGGGQGLFLTTRWSLVMRAGAEDDVGEEAMAGLCRDYWYPLYAFLRRRGLSMEDAQDLTQEFFVHVLQRGTLAGASAEKGRFRSYLLGAMQNFLANERRRGQAQKRGGGGSFISIDEMQAESRFALEPADALTPEIQFERSWAFSLLERVGQQLAADYSQAGRAVLFEKLHPYLAGKPGRSGYLELGMELGMSEGAVAVAIHRMRRRYGELLREEIAHTVESAEEVQGELDHLMKVVGRV